jgi:succinyl-CoA synthetase beta subunit
MDLLEYQAKELFRQVGIPVLPSQTIEDASELKRLKIPLPVVLKSQVRVGGRGKAGGIRFVENTIDAIAAARTIFNLPILGEYPKVLLAEARYNPQREFFLAIVLDYHLKRPVLLGSAEGGMNVEALLANLRQVVIEEDFSPFHARKLVIEMGLQGSLIEPIEQIVEKMYHLFITKDLDLIEINPLGVNAQGELMALDGKITVNYHAVNRHEDFMALATAKTDSLCPQWLDGIDEKGQIGIVANGFDLSLAIWDAISQEKGRLSCCAIIGEDEKSDLSQELLLALERMLEIKGIRVIAIDLLGNYSHSETIAQTIVDFVKNSVKQIPIVVRAFDETMASAIAETENLPIYWTNHLEEAASKAVSLSKNR